MDAAARYLFYIFAYIYSFNAFTAESPCPNQLCQLAADGAFDKFVVGKIVHIANDDEFKTVLQVAKQQGYWQTQPDDFSIYAEAARLVSIQYSPTKKPVSLFMLQKEFDAAPLHKDDFARYRPHNLEWEIPKSPAENALFATLTGCIAQLCSAEDKLCMEKYHSGIFALDGKAYDLKGNALTHATSINPETFQPLF